MTPANDNALPELAVELRPMRGADRNYVLSSWLCSYCESAEFRRFRRDVYFALYWPVVNALIDKSTVVVACMPDADDVILGWMAAEPDALHYVYVKRRWRGLGIVRKLLAGTESIRLAYSHHPPTDSEHPERRVPSTWTYDPMRRFRKAA